MRILHTADWHLGKNLEGHSRMDEQEEFLEELIKIIEEEKVDMVIVAGDVYDNSNPPSRAEKMFYKALKRMSNNGERLILIIAGNHDNPERLVAAGPLATEHGIIMVGTPKTIIEPSDYGKHKVINSGEGFIEVVINNQHAVILTIPYPSEKRLNEVLYGEMTSEEQKGKEYAEKIADLFNSLSKNFRKDTINIVVSHLFSMGSEESGSERSIQLGGSYIVSGDVFPKEAQYIALGHVHKPQIVPKTNKRARYSGSPIHYNKKEINYDKKCFIVDLEPNKEAVVNERIFSVYKPIEIWKCNSIEEAINKCEENKGKESYVYLEIKTDRYIHEDEIKQMKLLKDDIIEVLPIFNQSQYETNEVPLTERPFKDVFCEFYLKERGVEPDEEIVDLLLSIINEENLDETN